MANDESRVPMVELAFVFWQLAKFARSNAPPANAGSMKIAARQKRSREVCGSINGLENRFPKIGKVEGKLPSPSRIARDQTSDKRNLVVRNAQSPTA